jgi:ribulose-bisphosphate carboxylase small chain
LSIDEIGHQVHYALEQGWIPAVEYCTFPHPRNCFWEMAGLPLFEFKKADDVLDFVEDLLNGNLTDQYIRMCFYDNTRGSETCVGSFMISRPETGEVNFSLGRLERDGRNISYTIQMDLGEGESELERYLGLHS